MIMNSNNLRDAIALHKEALDLRSYLTMNELSSPDKAINEDEPRSPSPTCRSSRSGVILFDPKELVDEDAMTCGHERSVRRRPFRLDLEEPERDKSDEDEAPDNQKTHEIADPTLSTNERLRNQVIAEICSTEGNYVRDIRTLHDFYIVPLEDNKHPIMEDAQIAVFFNNLRQLVMLNSKLLNDLLDIVERRAGVLPLGSPSLLKVPNHGSSRGNQGKGRNGSPQAQTEGIGAVFCRYAPLFKLYAGYAKDYEEVAQLLQSYKRDSRLGFGQFLETCQARSGSDKSFESLLIMPIQRIPRYKLLLERICEYTPAGHRDEAFLTEAVNGVSFAASFMNETVRHQENLESVLEAQKKFAGQLSLFTADRRLIRSGKLIKMSTKRHEEVMLHLFNDILLYSGMLITGGYRVRRVVQLHSKAVSVRTEIPSSHLSLFERRSLQKDCAFVVASQEKTFVLFAASPDERVTWVSDINAAIDAARKDSSGLRNEVAADAAALWVPDAVAGACAVCHASFKLYFRRHHCRRCGAVVCGNCSDQRSILFTTDTPREERVCLPCYSVLQCVKVAAFKWLSLVVEFKGVLRRKRWNKWSEHYYELKAGILKQYTLSSATPLSMKCCTDTLDLTGAIVIHRSDERSHKNRFCFQISTSDLFEENFNRFQDSPAKDDDDKPKKLSPLKAAVNRFGESSRIRESTGTLVSDGSLTNMSRTTPEITGWILCATNYNEEMDWSNAIQRSADKALNRARRSRVTECSFPVPFEKVGSTPSSCAGSNILSDVDSFADEVAKMEHRRLQIMKELVRSEESYVTCLGECIRVYVQPLLLRQLEAQKTIRRKQSKSKKSLLQSFSGSGSNAISAAAALAQRTYSNNNLGALASMRKIGTSRSLTLTDSRPAQGALSAPKPLVLDADMAIFFSSIDQICTLNQQLLEHLSRHLMESQQDDQEENVLRPGAIFNAYAPLFQLYTAYASRHEAALNAIESPQFELFLREIPDDNGSLHRLRTYLNMPMERIPRYKVFLQELLDSTSPDHLDFTPLQAAIKSVNMVANKVQEISARRESARKLDEISGKVGMDLRGKRFVLDGALKKVCRSKVKQYYFVLLEDALVYGRHGGGLQKKKFRLIDLWECKVSDDSETVPRAVNVVAGGKTSHNAFFFYSPLKSFILVAPSEEAKARWMTAIQESIDKTLRGPRSSRRASIRSELLVDEEESSNEYELESAFVIKNGWLNVAFEETKRRGRMWITLTMQSVTISKSYNGVNPEESLSIGLCEAVPMKEPTFFRIYVRNENASQHALDRRAYTFETQTIAECDEWLRALNHCISGSAMTNIVEMRRRSLNSAALAPIFMFNKVSNVCTICYHSFAVYRPRHHCRMCGSLVCGNCSRRKWALTYGATKKASRICDACITGVSASATSLVSEV